MKKIVSLLLVLAFATSLLCVASATDVIYGKSGWLIEATSERGQFPSANAIDGNDDSYWHSDYADDNSFKATCPHDLTITLPFDTVISGVIYTPRSENLTGTATKVVIYVSDSSTGDFTAVAEQSLELNGDKKTIPFAENVKVRRVRFRIVESNYDYGTCAEIDFLEKDPQKKTADSPKALAASAGVSIVERVPHANMKAVASTEWTKSLYAAGKAIDGTQATAWHSHPDKQNQFPVTFDVDLGAEYGVTGFMYLPRIDADRAVNGVWTAFNVEASKDGKTYQTVKSGVGFEANLETQTVNFDAEVSARYFRFVINAGTKGYATCGDLEFLLGNNTAPVPGTSGESALKEAPAEETAAPVQTNTAGVVSRDGWRVTATSVKQGRDASCMLDGKQETYWHSDYTDENNMVRPPFYLTFYLPTKQTISGIRYMPRTDNASGLVTAYNVYVSDSDTGEATLIYSGNMEKDYSTKTVNFGFNVDVRTMIFEITAGNYDYGTCAEFDMLAKQGSDVKTIASVGKGNTITIGENVITENGKRQMSAKDFIDKSGWTITASSEHAPNVAARAIDGNVNTFWHTDYTDDGVATILTKVEGPHWIDVTLPEAVAVSGFRYSPRPSVKTGVITMYEFYGSPTDDGELELITDGALDLNNDPKTVAFLQNVKIKKFRFKSVASDADYGVIGEFDLISENKELASAASIADYAEYCNENQLVQIPSEKFIAEASNFWRANYEASKVTDNVWKTSWHTHPDDKNKYPFELYIDMGRSYTIEKIIYYPRIDDMTVTNGIWEDFDVLASMDGNNFTTVISHGSLEVNHEAQDILPEEAFTARYLTFVINKGVGGYATCGDLKFFEKKGQAAKRLDDRDTFTLQIGSNVIHSTINGVESDTTIDVAPFIDSDYTQIPLRGLLEAMGATITWGDEYQTIDIACGDIRIEMQIFNDLVYVTDTKYGRVRYTLRTAPQIKDSRTFVPLRFISENLGYEVSWDGATQTITVKK